MAFRKPEFVDILAQALASPWGIAGPVFVVLSILAMFTLQGQLRAFVAILTLAVAVLLGAVAVFVSLPDEEFGAEALAGLQTDIPNTERELAERLMLRALDELNSGNTREARYTYGRARSIFRKTYDILGEGQAALRLAQLEHITGQSDTARANFAESTSLFRQGGSALWLAQALVSWGDLEKDTFNWERAASLYAQAQDEWTRAPTSKHSDHVILRMVSADSLPAAEGREVLDKANLIFGDLNDRTGLGDVSMRYGDLEFRDGNLTTARNHYGKARTYYIDGPHPDREAEAILHVARIDLARGYNVQAAYGLDLAEPIYLRAGNHGGLAIVRVFRGDVARLTGELDQAGGEYAAAAAAFNALSHRDEPVALLRLGQIQAATGNAETAHQTLLDSIALFRRFNLDAGEAQARLAHGVVSRRNGSFPAAALELQQAEDLFRDIGNALGQGRALLEWAEVDAAMGRTTSAMAHIDEAATLFISANSTIGRVEAALQSARQARDRGDSAGAAVLFSRSVELFAAIESPLAAMNGFLGLPETDTLRISRTINATNLYEVAALVIEELTPEDVAAMEANLAAHPSYLTEGREALADLTARVAEAQTFVRTQN